MTRRIAGIAIGVLATVTAWGSRQAASAPPSTAPRSAPAAAATPDGGSIFDLDLSLVDQQGARVRLADLAGRPLVVTMIYTRCTSVCPRVTDDMKAIERALGARAAGVTFVLFSLDPNRDTPAALQRFAVLHHLDPARWRLLAAPEDGVRDLAAVLGVRYSTTPGGEIAHAAVVVVVDARGVIRYRQPGVAQDVQSVIAAVGF
jgi:protein SCO1/2